jgi:hypothetical protein
MNAINSNDVRRNEQSREPEGFAEVSRTEMEQTEGGMLMWPTIFSDFVVLDWSGYIRR